LREASEKRGVVVVAKFEFEARSEDRKDRVPKEDLRRRKWQFLRKKFPVPAVT
jgi:hypothetical protein